MRRPRSKRELEALLARRVAHAATQARFLAFTEAAAIADELVGSVPGHLSREERAEAHSEEGAYLNALVDVAEAIRERRGRR